MKNKQVIHIPGSPNGLFRVRTVRQLHAALTLMSIIFCLAVYSSAENVDASRKSGTGPGQPYKRIISLYTAHTENLCSLGATSQLIGISKSDDYPEEILSRPKFSYRDDPEKFIGMQPDLVLVRPMIERSYPQFIEKLRQAGIEVVSLQPNSIEEMYGYWRSLGALSGREKEAEQLVASFKGRLDRIRLEVSKIKPEDRPGVYFESIHSKMKTFSPESIAVFVLEEAGGVNIGADAVQVRETNIAFYGKERLLSRGADIDIYLAQQGRMNPVDVETIRSEPGFLAIKAVREEKVFLIEEALVSRPTMRILDGIDKLYTLFHGHSLSTVAD
jgi:iron complex transport system substrate-binding protein